MGADNQAERVIYAREGFYRMRKVIRGVIEELEALEKEKGSSSSAPVVEALKAVLEETKGGC
jgi:hypothetical protein